MPSYTVRQGQSLAKIAKAAGINWLDLVAANPQILDPDLIHPGQKIFLPTKPRSAAERNIAAQRVASGSYSAGTFSATGGPEGMMEVGQWQTGRPGGGYGTKYYGMGMGEYFNQVGNLPGYLPYGSDDAPRITGPVGAGGVGPTGQAIPGVAPTQFNLPEGFDATKFNYGDYLENVVAPKIAAFDDAARKTTRPRGRDKGGFPSDVPTGAVSEPRTPGGTRGRDKGGFPAAAGVPQPSAVPIEVRRSQRGIPRPVSTPITPWTGAKLEAHDPLAGLDYLSQIDAQEMLGIPRHEAASRQPWKYQWDRTQNMSVVSVWDGKKYVKTTYNPVTKSWTHKGKPVTWDEKTQTFVLPSKATSDFSPEEAANYVANAHPSAIDPELAALAAQAPVTYGQKRWFSGTNVIYSPEKILQAQNWDRQVVADAARLASGILYDTEWETIADDAIHYLDDLSRGDQVAIDMLRTALDSKQLSIRKGPGGQPSNQELVEELLRIVTTNPASVWESVAGKELLKVINGEKTTKEFLASYGYENNPVEDYGNSRIWSIDDGSGSSIEDLMGGGTGGFAPFGRNYRSPDYIEPKRRGGDGGGISAPGPGFGGSGYGGGVTLYQWRISAPGVS